MQKFIKKFLICHNFIDFRVNFKEISQLPPYNHNLDLVALAICIFNIFSPSTHLQHSMSSLLRFSSQAARLTAVIKHSKYATNMPLLVPIGHRVRSEYQQSRGHKNFGHKPTPIPNMTRLWHLFTGGMIIVSLLNYKL